MRENEKSNRQHVDRYQLIEREKQKDVPFYVNSTRLYLSIMFLAHRPRPIEEEDRSMVTMTAIPVTEAPNTADGR